MSAGIQHLLKNGKTRPARIDSMDADNINSIIERISGVNPSKLAAEATGKPMHQPQVEQAPVTAPMTAAAQGFDPYVQRSQQGGQPDVNQLMQRMQMLEQKVAYYEQGKGDPSFSADNGPSNRGPESRVWRRDMDPKKAKKKDPVDGEPDSKQAQSGGQAMANEHVNILGMPMSEWRDLCGIQGPSVNMVDGNVPAHVMAESYEYEDEEEFSESYINEDELAEAWFEFISDKGWDPEEFHAFAEAAEAYGDEVALLAIQDLEDEFQEAIESLQEPGLTQEDVDELWGAWLEDRGLSVQLFNHLVDEAIASEDTDEMDTLLAVEGIFNQWLENILKGATSSWDVKQRLRGKGGQQLSPEDLGLKRKMRGGGKSAEKEAPKPGQGTMPRRGLKTASMEAAEPKLPPMHPKMRSDKPGKPSEAPPAKAMMPNKPAPKAKLRKIGKQPEMSDKEKMSKLDKMLGRSGATLRKESALYRFLQQKLDEGTPVSKDDPIHKEIAGMRSLVKKKSSGQSTIQFPGEKPQKMVSLAGRKLRKLGKKAEENLEFECDDDGTGNPSIPWEKIVKGYKSKKGQ